MCEQRDNMASRDGRNEANPATSAPVDHLQFIVNDASETEESASSSCDEEAAAGGENSHTQDETTTDLVKLRTRVIHTVREITQMTPELMQGRRRPMDRNKLQHVNLPPRLCLPIGPSLSSYSTSSGPFLPSDSTTPGPSLPSDLSSLEKVTNFARCSSNC